MTMNDTIQELGATVTARPIKLVSNNTHNTLTIIFGIIAAVLALVNVVLAYYHLKHAKSDKRNTENHADEQTMYE